MLLPLALLVISAFVCGLAALLVFAIDRRLERSRWAVASFFVGAYALEITFSTIYGGLVADAHHNLTSTTAVLGQYGGSAVSVLLGGWLGARGLTAWRRRPHPPASGGRTPN